MSWIDEPTTEIPTDDEIRLLQIEQGKQLLREAQRFSDQSARMRALTIERAFGIVIETETGDQNENVEQS